MHAINHYRRDHGRYPDRLEALVPAYLPRVPIDYAVRQPMRYRVMDEDYLLYSVGLNGIDDGGMTVLSDPSQFEGFGAQTGQNVNPDVVFNRIQRREYKP